MAFRNFILFGVVAVLSFISNITAQDIILRDVLVNPAALKARGAVGLIIAKKLKRPPFIQKLNGPKDVSAIDKPSDADNPITAEKSSDAEGISTVQKSIDISNNDLTADQTDDTQDRKFSIGKLVKKIAKNKIVRKVVGGAAEAIGLGATNCVVNGGC